MYAAAYPQAPELRAFARALYQRYYNELYRYLFWELNSAEEASLVLSDTFVRVMQNIARLSLADDQTVRTCLFGYAHASMCNFLRHKQRHAQPPTVSVSSAEANDCGGTCAAEPVGEDDVCALLLQKEAAAQIAAAIEALAPAAREIVLLKFYSNLKNTEIAAALGMNASTVGTILQRSLQKLRKQLEAYYYGEDH